MRYKINYKMQQLIYGWWVNVAVKPGQALVLLITTLITKGLSTYPSNQYIMRTVEHTIHKEPYNCSKDCLRTVLLRHVVVILQPGNITEHGNAENATIVMNCATTGRFDNLIKQIRQ